METLFLLTAILVFGSGCILAAFASRIPYRLIKEINEWSSSDRQIDSPPRLSEAVWRRHRELFPNSPKRRLMSAMAVTAVLMMLAGIGLALDYSSLHELNRNQAVAPRQQMIAGTLTAGPAGRNSYCYTFTVGGVSYSDWGLVNGPDPKIGQEVLVYYDPQDPTVSALARFEFSGRQRARDVGLGLFLILLIAAGSAVAIPFARRAWNRPSVANPNLE